MKVFSCVNEENPESVRFLIRRNAGWVSESYLDEDLSVIVISYLPVQFEVVLADVGVYFIDHPS